MIALSAGPLSARIVPEAGGIVAALEWRGPDGRLHKLLHAPDGAVPSTAAPNMFGTWAMLPFANRAFGSLVDDGERRFEVPANNPRGGGNIHGFGWQSAWEVLRHDLGHTVIEHRRTEGPDPYRYRATQEISLDEAGMTIAISLTNEADTALPYGLGHHPWFPCAPDTRLGMTAGRALVFGEAFRALGVTALAAGGPYAGAPVFATGQETAWSFLEWGGTARIETPSQGSGGGRIPLRRAPEPRHRLSERSRRSGHLAAAAAGAGRDAGGLAQDRAGGDLKAYRQPGLDW